METQEKNTQETTNPDELNMGGNGMPDSNFGASEPLTSGTGSNRSLATDGPLAQTIDEDDDDLTDIGTPLEDDDDDELVEGDIPDDLDADFNDDDDLLADDDDDLTNVDEDDLDTLDGPLRDINNPT
jgi:hypothetical protein